jgi:predicted RNA-binding protein
MKTIIFQINGKVLKLEVLEENVKIAGKLQGEHEFKGDVSWLHGCLVGLEQNKELLEGLKDAVLQIEYLNNKFLPTGTSESILSRLGTLIQKYEAS